MTQVVRLDTDRSDFLHALRWLAACAVVLGHAQMYHQSISGRRPAADLPGQIWEYIGAHAHSAVMVFFVLSGFVVAYATDQKRAANAGYGMRDYFADRWSRIYSVLLPAILLTLVIDVIGKSQFPAYANPAHYPQDREWLRFALNVLGLQGSWGVRAQMGSNPALWSIAYELAFYMLWGVICFRDALGRRPWLKLAVLVVLWFAIFGWKIAIYFVPWLMGVMAWRRIARGAKNKVAAPLPMLLLLVLLLMANHFINYRGLTGYEIVNDSVYALCVALILMADVKLPTLSAQAGEWLRLFNRWMADFSYSIYAYHLPVIFFICAGLAVWPEAHLGYFMEFVILIATPLMIARLLYGVTEAKRHVFKRVFLRATAVFTR